MGADEKTLGFELGFKSSIFNALIIKQLLMGKGDKKSRRGKTPTGRYSFDYPEFIWIDTGRSHFQFDFTSTQ